MLNACRLSLQFFTTLPSGIGPYDEADFCRAVYFYPLVGGIIGSIITLLAWLLPNSMVALNSLWVLIAWIVLTGGLHWDGLADTADAWFGGNGDKEKTLRIMKDPCAGPIAVLTLFCLCSLKVVALYHILQHHAWHWILLSPIIARTWVLVLLVSTPYAKTSGLGSAFYASLQWQWVLFIVITLIGASVLLLNLAILITWGVTFVIFFLLRQRMLARLQGVTGDTAGALIEIEECIVLLCAVYLM